MVWHALCKFPVFYNNQQKTKQPPHQKTHNKQTKNQNTKQANRKKEKKKKELNLTTKHSQKITESKSNHKNKHVKHNSSPCTTLLILYRVIDNDGSVDTAISQAPLLVHLKPLLVEKVMALTEGADSVVPAEMVLCFGDVALKGEACGRQVSAATAHQHAFLWVPWPGLSKAGVALVHISSFCWAYPVESSFTHPPSPFPMQLCCRELGAEGVWGQVK